MGTRKEEKLSASSSSHLYFSVSTSLIRLRKITERLLSIPFTSGTFTVAYQKFRGQKVKGQSSNVIFFICYPYKEMSVIGGSTVTHHGLRWWICRSSPFLLKNSSEYCPERAICRGMLPSNSMMCAKWSERKGRFWLVRGLHMCKPHCCVLVKGLHMSKLYYTVKPWHIHFVLCGEAVLFQCIECI